MKRRTFLRNTAASMLAAPFVTHSLSSFGASITPAQERIPVIIDADTANEIDDLWAIARMLLAPEMEVLGLNSAQWAHELATDNTVMESQRLNQDILDLMDRRDIPTPIGSERKFGMPWGGDQARPSGAAHFIIRTAKQYSPENKLTVITLGASTNLASALKMAPEIVPNIKAYALGAKFFPERNVWDKNEFNIRRDLNSFNFLCNLEGLDFSLMPINILYDFKADRDAMVERLTGHGGVWDYLAARWLSNAPGDKSRIFWDLALAIAVINPEMAEGGMYNTPPENKQREIFVYTKIDEEKMWEDWWGTAEANW